jgi:transposase
MDITDKQWKVIETILPTDRVRADRRGRPWSDRRTVLNGVLWILPTGASKTGCAPA